MKYLASILAIIVVCTSAQPSTNNGLGCPYNQTEVHSEGGTKCVLTANLQEITPSCNAKPVSGFFVDTVGSDDSKIGTLYRETGDNSTCARLLSFQSDNDTLIRYIEGSTFDENFNLLRGMELYDQALEHINDFTFEGLTSLALLDLGKNKISVLRSQDVGNASSVISFLLLDDNEIHEIEEDTFYNLDSLQQLTLFGNNLTGLYPETFAQSPSLNTLRLDDNPWICSEVVPALSQPILGNTDGMRVVDTLAESPSDSGQYGECVDDTGAVIGLKEAVPPPPVETGIYEFPLMSEILELTDDQVSALEDSENVFLRNLIDDTQYQGRLNLPV
eukprot:CFRG0627T1